MAANESPRTKETKRQPSIDLLRFIAAIMVATMHWGLEVGSKRYSAIYDSPIIGDLIKNGGFGVDIFFVISGFVIIGTAQKYNAHEFLLARFVRLFPGLLLSMLVVLIVGSYFIHPYEKPFSSFFHSIFLTYQVAEIQPLATQLWTLIIEIKFYLGIAIALFLFPKLFSSTTGIICLLISWESVTVILEKTTSTIGNFMLPYLTLNRFNLLFAFGICLFLLGKMKLNVSIENLLIALVSLYFVNEVFFISGYPNTLKLFMALTSLAILFSKKIDLPESLQKICYWLGLSSYLIYLLHEHLGMAFVLQIQYRITSNIFFVVGTAVVLITLSCVLLAIFIEKPLQKYLKLAFHKL